MKSTILKSIVTITAFATLPMSLEISAQNLQSGTGQIHYSVINLGTLGGTESNGFGGVNNRGWVTGDANLAGDLNEHAALWRDGVITDLGTVGGPNSSAPMPVKDDRGFVVGVAQIATVDPLSELWGTTFVCTPSDTVTNLGSLGGVMSNAANGINNLGQVVGQSNLPGDAVTHAFLWQNGVMTDLGTLPGDSISIAFDINKKGQIVGISCDLNFNYRPFLWENGVMTDLNTLIPPNSPLYLTFGGGINDRGEITGSACVLSNGVCTSEVPAFWAIPCRQGDTNNEECQNAVEGPFGAAVRPAAVLPQNMREHLRLHRAFGRLGSRPREQ
jgi:probable HAF family extracellular repeat protein